jgi:hypothetical protein
MLTWARLKRLLATEKVKECRVQGRVVMLAGSEVSRLLSTKRIWSEVSRWMVGGNDVSWLSLQYSCASDGRLPAIHYHHQP